MSSIEDSGCSIFSLFSVPPMQWMEKEWQVFKSSKTLIPYRSGYNTSQALKVLPKFMPTPSQASVRLMVS